MGSAENGHAREADRRDRRRDRGAVNGSTPGFRAVHAKGTVCEGTFTATPEAAAALGRAAHLQGDPFQATVRFSNASGNPKPPTPTRSRDAGMAVKFHLPDGEATDLVDGAAADIDGPQRRGLPRLHQGA